MRKKQQKQMPLIEPASGHPQDRELEIISLLIDNTPTICDYVLQDLNEGKGKKRNTGAEGMSADQVLRAAVVMHLYSFTYEQLAFHIYDSRGTAAFLPNRFRRQRIWKIRAQREHQKDFPFHMGTHFKGPVDPRPRPMHREGAKGAHRLYGGRKQYSQTV